MRVRNEGQLRAALEEKLRGAMEQVQADAKKEMDKAIKGFYAGGKPKMYKRTYHLAETPTVSDLNVKSGEHIKMYFKAYLNQGLAGYPAITYTYPGGFTTTSKAPTMTDVLNLTNNLDTSSSVGYLHPAVGSPHYWEKAVDKIGEALNNRLSEAFS